MSEVCTRKKLREIALHLLKEIASEKEDSQESKLHIFVLFSKNFARITVFFLPYLLSENLPFVALLNLLLLYQTKPFLYFRFSCTN